MPIYFLQVELNSKREKLQDQLDEAKKLKENIEQRNKVVSAMLKKYLNDEEFERYEHFVSQKSKVIMDLREISDKIALFEDQLKGLQK